MAIQRNPGYYRKMLPSCRLHLDDLQRMVDCMRALSPESTVEIRAGEYSCDSIDDLKEIPPHGRINEVMLSITCSNRGDYVSVDLRRKGDSIVYSSRDDAARVGLASQIDKICRNSRMLPYVHFPAVSSVALAGVCGFIAKQIMTSGASWPTAYLQLFFVVVFGAFSGFFLAASIALTPCSGVRVVFVDRRDVSGFWKRNGDKVIVSLISTIFGAVAGVAGTLFVSKFK